MKEVADLDITAAGTNYPPRWPATSRLIPITRRCGPTRRLVPLRSPEAKRHRTLW